jgi:putative oxidoreductase
MLASIFVIQGYSTLREPERVAAVAEPVVRLLAERVPAVPAKTEQAVRINGAIQMLAGSLLALGRLPRLSALAIAATLVPTTAAGHRFWEAEDAEDQARQRIQFLKNLALFGGLLIAGADTAGRPSLAWRAEHAARSTRRQARSTRNQATRLARTAKTSAQAGAAAGKFGRRVPRRLSASGRSVRPGGGPRPPCRRWWRCHPGSACTPGCAGSARRARHASCTS